MNLGKYSKAIVAAAGAIAIALNTLLNTEVITGDMLINVGIAVATMLGVYQVANKA